MDIAFLYGPQGLQLRLPDDAIVYESAYPAPSGPPADLVMAAVRRPGSGPSLGDALAARRPRSLVIVVSDVTRPIPYAAFLPELLAEIEAAGVPREGITILIGTGMHRPSTPGERAAMFGQDVVAGWRIVDHVGSDPAELAPVPGRSWSGNEVTLNRHYLAADFKVITGLVEPHFMAGFSGGRKAVCPGLSSLATIAFFHGYETLADPRAGAGVLAGNPCHEEALSVARLAGVDFSLNVVVNRQRAVVQACAGELEAAHREACEFVAACACPAVQQMADVAVTSCGGYPLDATFYQCVKGMVTCLPAVRPGGQVLAFGSCLEGVGSPEYTETMQRYSGAWRQFLHDIREADGFVRDQWQLQMQCRVLAHLGDDHLWFGTSGLDQAQLAKLSVQPIAALADHLGAALQARIDALAAAGQRFAVFPEGPYCTPLSAPAELAPEAPTAP